MRNGHSLVLGAMVYLMAIGAAVGSTVVEFPDPALETVIRETIHKPTGDILDTDLLGVQRLNGDNKGITDLTGLGFCVNLKALYLDHNQISDMSAVAGLTNLTFLYLGNNQITDISAVAGLTNLTDLDLGSNQITDMSAAAGLTNLNTLWLSSNQISDMSAVAGLTNLTELHLHNNQITDMSAVAGLTNLTRVWLSSNQISDMRAVAGLTNLTELLLYGNQISDMRAVAGLPNLTKLWLNTNQISDISAVAGLTNLIHLFLYNNQISDMSAVAGLANLTILYLYGNQITDMSAVAGLTNLTFLDLAINQITDMSAVAGLTNLTELDLRSNQITDMNAVAGLTNLTELRLENNQISDMSALIDNTGIGSGDIVWADINPLGQTALCYQIPLLQERGVTVHYSGSCQEGQEGEEGQGEGEAEGLSFEGSQEEGQAEGISEGEWEWEGEEGSETYCETDEAVGPHSADVDQDWTISMSEMLRVTQFYNSGGYHCDATGEDGYAPGPGDTDSCAPHSSDYNSTDWRIDLTELLRITQLYNVQRYALSLEGSEDGYEPYFSTSDITLFRHVSPSGVVTLILQYCRTDHITGLGIEERLPEGWQFTNWVSDTRPDLGPASGAQGTLTMAWFNIPTFPVTLSYRVTAPSLPTECEVFRGQVLYRTYGPEFRSKVVATPVRLGEGGE